MLIWVALYYLNLGSLILLRSIRWLCHAVNKTFPCIIPSLEINENHTYIWKFDIAAAKLITALKSILFLNLHIPFHSCIMWSIRLSILLRQFKHIITCCTCSPIKVSPSSCIIFTIATISGIALSYYRQVCRRFLTWKSSDGAWGFVVYWMWRSVKRTPVPGRIWMRNYVNGIVGITIRNCVICAIINTVINYFRRSSTVADYWWFGGGASTGKEIE